MSNLEYLCIPPSSSIRHAVEYLDRNSKGIVLICDEQRHLIGTVTDGDIRRALLCGENLDAPVMVLMDQKKRSPYPKPATAPVGSTASELLKVMRDHVVRQVPLLDGHGRVQDLVTLDEMVPLSEPHLAGNEWNYVKECLDKGWVSSAGSFVDRFERETAAHVGSKYAVAVSSGTAALHIALLAAGIRPDDEVLVSTLTFIAPGNAIRYVGAWPVFMDAEPNYWQMDPKKLRRFLETECRSRPGGLYNRVSGRRVKAVLPVHALGHPCPTDEILEEARKHDLIVIEDAAESLGAQYKGAATGRMGDLGCLSFNGNKIITTGGGGMIVTDDETSASRAAYLSTQAKDEPVEYVHREIGYNYRLSNIQAAMGCAQLEQLERHVTRKREIAETYHRELSCVPGITTMREASWANASFWMYTILVDEALYGTDSRSLMHRLARAGIQSRPLWQPLHLSPAHAGCQSYSCDTAEKLYRQGLSLPSFVGMTESQQARVIACIKAGGNRFSASVVSERKGYEVQVTMLIRNPHSKRENPFRAVYDNTDFVSVLENKDRLPRFPFLVDIELTNHCNLACVMCARHTMQRDKGFMSEEIFRKVVDECAEHITPVRLI